MPHKDPRVRSLYRSGWASARRKAWLKGKVCAICGATENLQIDHIDPKQKVSHRIWSWSPTRQQPELTKCRALCEPCHRKVSRTQCAKLTPEIVAEMRILHSGGAAYRAIGRMFKVSERTVRDAINRKSWKDIP